MDVKEFVKCVNFAAVKHKNQRRKDTEKTPYINHPIGVAYILTESDVDDQTVLQAALLHDTVEDTDTTIDEIKSLFGQDVAGIVEEVTDDKSLLYLERKQLQIVHAAESSTRAKLVKLADKLYNLRDLMHCTPNGWSEKRIQEYFEWAAKVIKGLRGVNMKLEQQLDEILKRKGVYEFSV